MRIRFFALAAIAVLTLSAQSCANLKAGYDVATSATVTRNEVQLLVQTTTTIQDIASTAMDGCTAAKSVAGPCKPAAIDAIHQALVATRQPRKNLVAFAQSHAGSQLGASGLYDALLTAKNSLASVLTQYGYAVPAT